MAPAQALHTALTVLRLHRAALQETGRHRRMNDAMNRTVSRRDFMNMVGAAGGSTAVYRAAMGLGLLPLAAHAVRPQLAAVGAKAPKVLILGGGISGLTAAYELNKKGYSVQVLEASHRAGGRNMTLRSGD